MGLVSHSHAFVSLALTLPGAAVSLSGESTPDDVRNLTIPTLILASELDHYFPGATARQVFAAIPAVDKQLKVFPGNLRRSASL